MPPKGDFVLDEERWEEDRGRLKCKRCDGVGDEPIFDCLNRNVPPEIVSFFQALTFFEEQGVLPEPGAMQQQSATFVEAVAIAMSEKGRIVASLRED